MPSPLTTGRRAAALGDSTARSRRQPADSRRAGPTRPARALPLRSPPGAPAGRSAIWRPASIAGRDAGGALVAGGPYFVRLEAEGRTLRLSLVILRRSGSREAARR